MTKLEALCVIASRVDLIAETQLTTFEVNLRSHGFDDDEVRLALRGARVINSRAACEFMSQVEAIVEANCADVIRSLAFTTASIPETVH